VPEPGRETNVVFGDLRAKIPVDRLRWIIDLRWWAVGVGFMVVLFAQSLWPIQYDLSRLVAGLILLALVNALYRKIWVQIQKKVKDPSALAQKARRHIHIQMSVDLCLLTLMLAASGGVENPFFMMYLFHLVIGSIALPWKESAVYAFLASSLPWGLWALEGLGGVHPLWLSSPPWGVPVLSALLTVYSACCLGVWFFLTSLTGDLLLKERELEEAGDRLRIANEDLWRLDDQKNRFFRQIAHELKNPVAAVGSCLEAAEAIWPRGKALRSKGMVERAKSRLDAVAELMDDLIWLSQAKSSDPPYRREEVHPYALVRRAAQDLEEKPGTRGLKIRVEGPPELKRAFWADPRAFRRVADNLLENAVKYTPLDRGPIVVRLEDQGRWLVMSVEDPGIGIPETELSGLFQEFVRASNARSSGQPGTGLGLAIVKRILDWHGGTVEIQSQQGKGTRVETKWPLML
jgi:signal transduction histidine kinase